MARNLSRNSSARLVNVDINEVDSPKPDEDDDDDMEVESPYQKEHIEPFSLDIEHEAFDALSIGREFHSGELGIRGRDDVPTLLTPRYKAHTKLEVMNAHGINTIVLSFNIVILLSVLFSIISIVLARSVFAQTYNFPLLPQKLLIFERPQSFIAFESVLSFLVFVYAVFLFVIYHILLVRYKTNSTSNEQIWVSVLLLSLLIYMNPFETAIRLSQSDVPAIQRSQGPPWAVVLYECCRLTSFSFASLLYVWLNSHSYRHLAARIAWSDWQFYLPKALLVALYISCKLLFLFAFGIIFSELPFASLVGALRLYGSLGQWPVLGICSVVGLTLFEAVICGFVLHDIYKTAVVHASADYTRHRTKRVGFRFFLHQHIVFYFAFSLTYFIILFGFPLGKQKLFFYTGGKENTNGSYFDIQYTPFGLLLCIIAYATIEAFTALPARSKLAFWQREEVRPNSAAAVFSEPEPISYRNREPGLLTDEHVASRPNCFTMQTHVKMFNLAWYIYYYGTSKEEKLNPDLSSNKLEVVGFVKDESTDTAVLVLESFDRICIAFKGTSSTKNMTTDVKVVQTALRNVLPTTPHSVYDGPAPPDEPVAAPPPNSRLFGRAKVHLGFAQAYVSVAPRLLSRVQSLLETCKRPVLLCGHSLGGALATLCSLDLAMQPWWESHGHGILVSTFGSPRVGNAAFRSFYDEKVCTHWRVVAGGDVITRLPKVGYAHVGRKVALTAQGDLFVDADALEVRLWHKANASVIHHRKSCYLLALRAWCSRNHGEDSERFWNFPVSRDDDRRFKEAFSKGLISGAPKSGLGTENEGSEFVVITPARKRKMRAARLRVWADAVDLLEPRSIAEARSVRGDDEGMLQKRRNEKERKAVALWAHLTRPVVMSLRRLEEHAAENGDDDVVSMALPMLN